jgi:hypothetical protein
MLGHCPEHQRLWMNYPCVFGNAIPDGATQSLEQLRLLSIFACDQQDQLAHVVYTTTVFSDQCFSVPHGSQSCSDHQCPANSGKGCGSNRLSR